LLCRVAWDLTLYGNLGLLNTAHKLSKHLVTWISLKPVFIRRLHFSGSLIDSFRLTQKLIAQSFPGVFFPLLNLSSVSPLTEYAFRTQNPECESLQQSAHYFCSSFEYIALKRPTEVGAGLVFSIFLTWFRYTEVFSDWPLAFCSF